jgi:hydroxymethylpyrimidine pyrophosphatase-like HAD family hydrolase
MKAKLYKSLNSDTYWLTVDGKLFADTEGGPLMAITNKLSVKNCIDIKNGYDLNKLAEDFAKYHSIYPTAQDDTEYGFKNGFNKAIEMNKDKVFTLKDVKQAIFNFANYDRKTISELDRMDMAVSSIQQPTEIDVEIKMEPCFYDQSLGGFSTSYTEDKPKEQPKLDSEGCLILKKL